MSAVDITAHVERLAAAAPQLTAGQLDRLAVLLAANSNEHRGSTPGAREVPVLASGRQDGGRHGPG